MPSAPPTARLAEQSAFAWQPPSQPTISVTRRRKLVLLTSSTTPQYPSPCHGRTQTVSPTDLPDERAPARRNIAASSLCPVLSAASRAVPQPRWLALRSAPDAIRSSAELFRPNSAASIKGVRPAVEAALTSA